MLPGSPVAPAGPMVFDEVYEPYRERLEGFLTGRSRAYPLTATVAFTGHSPESAAESPETVQGVLTVVSFVRWEFIQEDPKAYYYAAHDSYGRWIAGPTRPTRESLVWI